MNAPQEGAARLTLAHCKPYDLMLAARTLFAERSILDLHQAMANHMGSSTIELWMENRKDVIDAELKHLGQYVADIKGLDVDDRYFVGDVVALTSIVWGARWHPRAQERLWPTDAAEVS